MPGSDLVILAEFASPPETSADAGNCSAAHLEYVAEPGWRDKSSPEGSGRDRPVVRADRDETDAIATMRLT